MELIKKIKQSEAQAQEIVAQARTDAAAMAQQQRKDHQKSMEQAEHERKKAIDAAVVIRINVSLPINTLKFLINLKISNIQLLPLLHIYRGRVTIRTGKNKILNFK